MVKLGSQKGETARRLIRNVGAERDHKPVEPVFARLEIRLRKTGRRAIETSCR